MIGEWVAKSKNINPVMAGVLDAAKASLLRQPGWSEGDDL